MAGIFLSKRDQYRYRQISDFRLGRISRKEAARILQLSERSVSRISSRIERLGFIAVRHGNRGRRPANKVADTLKEKVMKLVEERYFDFNMLHCMEILKDRHDLQISRETFRRWCHEKQNVKKKKRRPKKTKIYRARMPAEGYLLQMDGSPHRYNGKDVWHLILAIDDATSEIPHAEFFNYETTSACMEVLKRIILKKGIPRALYVDKAGWAGGGKRVEFSQFHRACEELGIQVLFANTPEAKGRVERAFHTIQDRIIPELRMHKIRTMKKSNDYLLKQFLPKYWNVRNTVPPRDHLSEYRRLKRPQILEEVLCYKKHRAVDRANKISLYSMWYQLIHPNGRSLARKRVEVRHYDHKPMAIYFEGIKLKYSIIKRPRQQDIIAE